MARLAFSITSLTLFPGKRMALWLVTVVRHSRNPARGLWTSAVWEGEGGRPSRRDAPSPAPPRKTENAQQPDSHSNAVGMILILADQECVHVHLFPKTDRTHVTTDRWRLAPSVQLPVAPSGDTDAGRGSILGWSCSNPARGVVRSKARDHAVRQEVAQVEICR